MKDSVLVDNNIFYYKEKSYTIDEIKKEIGKNIEVLLLNENIIIKGFEDISKVSYSFIVEIIKIEYGDDLEILTHYEHCKKLKKLYLYSIGNGTLISSVAEIAQEIEVKPMQFYIKDILPNKYKRINNYIIVTMVNKCVYYIEVLYNCIVKSYIEKIEDLNISEKINMFSKCSKFLIDINIEKHINEEIRKDLNLAVIDIGGKIDEKICKA